MDTPNQAFQHECLRVGISDMQAMCRRTISFSLASLKCGNPQRGDEVQEIADAPQFMGTGGSRKQWAVGRRGGWRLLGSGWPMQSVHGNVQTPARAEVYAALQEASYATSPLIIDTDSVGVDSQLKRLRRGGEAGARHAALWRAGAPRLHKVIDVAWVKAHLTPEEALLCALAGGCPVHWHALNRGAQALAASGAAKAHGITWGTGALGVGNAWAPTAHQVSAGHISGRAAAMATTSRRRITHRWAPLAGAPWWSAGAWRTFHLDVGVRCALILCLVGWTWPSGLWGRKACMPTGPC